MKYISKAVFFFFFGTLFFACGGNETSQEQPQTTDSTATQMEEKVEHSQINNTETDTVGMVEDTVGTEGIATEAEEITEEKIVEETGMSFCDCVKKQKEIQKKIDESEDDEELMQLMQEMNELRNGDCKVLFIQDQTSVDQIEERKKRIAACK